LSEGEDAVDVVVDDGHFFHTGHPVFIAFTLQTPALDIHLHGPLAMKELQGI
jgi:hypothetical protein